MKLDLTAREIADVMRRRAAKSRRKLQGPKLETRRSKPKHGRERDRDYLGWLHHDLPCIACLVLGKPAATDNPIEAAHQKLQVPEKGLHRKLGVRPDDWQSLPLCAVHHRIGPLCCDPAQAKFWAIVGLEPSQVADLCRELYAAFQQDAPGAPVVREFAELARNGKK